MQLPELKAFASELAKKDNLTQADLAVALLWFERNELPEQAVSDLGRKLHALSLSGEVNLSRLTAQLRRHAQTVRSTRHGFVKLRLASLPALEVQYGSLVRKREALVEYKLIPEATVKGTRRYIERFVWQLNGCYEAGFYDGCGVLCRRLIESLLIEAFEHAGKASAIKHGADYRSLNEIIGIAGSGTEIKLARGTQRALERAKAIGDSAAHDRRYLTTAVDIDDMAHDLRRVVAELLHLSGLDPK